MTAIQYINEYYIKLSLRHFAKEEEFVSRCMEHLHQASASLHQNHDSALLVIQRGLLLLKVRLRPDCVPTFNEIGGYRSFMWGGEVQRSGFTTF